MTNHDILDLCRRLLAYEAALDTRERNTPAALYVSEKLRRHLSRLIGSAGFRSLLARALVLARAKDPALDVVHIQTDGALEGLTTMRDQIENPEAGLLLIVQLLALLTVFLGESLVLTLVFTIWPNLPGSEHRPLSEQRPLSEHRPLETK